jgi:hypothetical protein
MEVIGHKAADPDLDRTAPTAKQIVIEQRIAGRKKGLLRTVTGLGKIIWVMGKDSSGQPGHERRLPYRLSWGNRMNWHCNRHCNPIRAAA